MGQNHGGLDLVAILSPGAGSSSHPHLTLIGERRGINRRGMLGPREPLIGFFRGIHGDARAKAMPCCRTTNLLLLDFVAKSRWEINETGHRACLLLTPG
jgi:hypothetical protein